MDFENTKLAGYKLLFSLLFPESSYIYKLRFFPPTGCRDDFFSLWVTKGEKKNEQDQRIRKNIPTGLVQFPQPLDNTEVKQIMPTHHEKNPESY